MSERYSSSGRRARQSGVPDPFGGDPDQTLYRPLRKEKGAAEQADGAGQQEEELSLVQAQAERPPLLQGEREDSLQGDELKKVFDDLVAEVKTGMGVFILPEGQLLTVPKGTDIRQVREQHPGIQPLPREADARKAVVVAALKRFETQTYEPATEQQIEAVREELDLPEQLNASERDEPLKEEEVEAGLRRIEARGELCFLLPDGSLLIVSDSDADSPEFDDYLYAHNGKRVETTERAAQESYARYLPRYYQEARSSAAGAVSAESQQQAAVPQPQANAEQPVAANMYIRDPQIESQANALRDQEKELRRQLDGIDREDPNQYAEFVRVQQELNTLLDQLSVVEGKRWVEVMIAEKLREGTSAEQFTFENPNRDMSQEPQHSKAELDRRLTEAKERIIKQLPTRLGQTKFRVPLSIPLEMSLAGGGTVQYVVDVPAFKPPQEGRPQKQDPVRVRRKRLIGYKEL